MILITCILSCLLLSTPKKDPICDTWTDTKENSMVEGHNQWTFAKDRTFYISNTENPKVKVITGTWEGQDSLYTAYPTWSISGGAKQHPQQQLIRLLKTGELSITFTYQSEHHPNRTANFLLTRQP